MFGIGAVLDRITDWVVDGIDFDYTQQRVHQYEQINQITRINNR